MTVRSLDRRSALAPHPRHEELWATVHRTVPRGADARDDDPRPAVELPIWYLHVRYAADGEPAVLALLVEEYEPYCLSMARRFLAGRTAREDLDQVAREGLVVALRRFDPDRGLPFAAIATPTIVGRLRHHVRDQGTAIRLPRKAHELNAAAAATSERLRSALGAEPTLTQVAEVMEVQVDDLLLAQEAAHACATESLDRPTERGPGGIHDVVGGPDRDLDRRLDHVDLGRALSLLGPEAQELLRLYYVEELTQATLAERLGVSQMQVSRLLASAVRRLRSHLTPVPAA